MTTKEDNTGYSDLWKRRLETASRFFGEVRSDDVAKVGSICKFQPASDSSKWLNGELPDAGCPRFALVLEILVEGKLNTLAVAPIHFEPGFVLEGDLWVSSTQNSISIGMAVELWNISTVLAGDVLEVSGYVYEEVLGQAFALWQWVDTQSLPAGVTYIPTGRPILSVFDREFRDMEQGKLADLCEVCIERLDADASRLAEQLGDASRLRLVESIAAAKNEDIIVVPAAKDKIKQREIRIRASLETFLSTPMITKHKIAARHYQEHLAIFCGRASIITDIHNKIVEKTADPMNGGWLLLSAPAGSGKSAICARIAKDLGPKSGPSAETFLPPWLPGCAYVNAGDFKTADALIRAVVAQLNTMLKSPVSISSSLKRSVSMRTSDVVETKCDLARVVGGESFSQGGYSRNSKVVAFIGRQDRYGIDPTESIASDSFLVNGAYHDRRDELEPTISQHGFLREQYFGSDSDEIPPDIFRAALDRTVRDNGSSVVIIDAFDQTIDPENLLFLMGLPTNLPPGACVILSVRQFTPAAAMIQRERIDELVISNRLSPVDMDDFLGNSRLTTEFVTKLFRESSGIPLLMREPLRDVLLRGASPSDVDFCHSSNELFAHWIEDSRHMNRRFAFSALSILAIAEPAGALSKRQLRDAICAGGITSPFALNELTNELAGLGASIDGIEEDRLVISTVAFAEYLRDQLGETEVARLIGILISCLGRSVSSALPGSQPS